jgi:hypothetical protein
MSAVNLTNVAVLDNPTSFVNPFQFEISYECLVALEDGAFASFTPPSLLPRTFPMLLFCVFRGARCRCRDDL